jgi:hypothetical protein
MFANIFWTLILLFAIYAGVIISCAILQVVCHYLCKLRENDLIKKICNFSYMKQKILNCYNYICPYQCICQCKKKKSRVKIKPIIYDKTHIVFIGPAANTMQIGTKSKYVNTVNIV